MNKYRFNKLWEDYDNILADAIIINYGDISESIANIEQQLSIVRKDEDCNGIEHEIESIFSLYKELFLNLHRAKHLQVIIEKTNQHTVSQGNMDRAVLQGKMDELFSEARLLLSTIAVSTVNPVTVAKILDMPTQIDTECRVEINECPITKMHYDRFDLYHKVCMIYLEIYSRKTCLLESDLLEE